MSSHKLEKKPAYEVTGKKTKPDSKKSPTKKETVKEASKKSMAKK